MSIIQFTEKYNIELIIQYRIKATQGIYVIHKNILRIHYFWSICKRNTSISFPPPLNAFHFLEGCFNNKTFIWGIWKFRVNILPIVFLRDDLIYGINIIIVQNIKILLLIYQSKQSCAVWSTYNIIIVEEMDDVTICPLSFD